MAGVKIDGDFRRLSRTIRNMGELEFKNANKAIGQVLRASVLQRFRDSKDPDGKTWEPTNQGNNKKTLINTARLRNSIHSKVTKKGVALGTNTIYAATHQFGDKDRLIKAKGKAGLVFNVEGKWRRKKIVKVTIPARPFLGINDEDIREIKATMLEFVEEATT